MAMESKAGFHKMSEEFILWGPGMFEENVTAVH